MSYVESSSALYKFEIKIYKITLLDRIIMISYKKNITQMV